MNTFDYILDSALVLIVILQLKERKMTLRQLVRPVVILAIAVANYLHGFPSQGNDLELIGAFAVIGAASGPESAFFWVLGMGSRFAFIYWITHTGGATIARWSVHHSISGSNTWTVALLGMAAFEVLSRTAIMGYRWNRLESKPNVVLA
jgi:hypothetical protein